MSVAGISASSLFNLNSQSVQTRRQQLQQEFQQLGQDLQSGNLSAAQADFATLQQAGTQNSTSSSQSSHPLTQAFRQLASDLQSGNVKAAQQDFATIQQDLQNRAAQGHHHHHHGGGGEGAELNQTLQQLGQDLPSGSLSSPQQAYTSLQGEFAQLTQSEGFALPAASGSGAHGVSVTA